MQARYEQLDNRILRSRRRSAADCRNTGLWLRQSDAGRRTDRDPWRKLAAPNLLLRTSHAVLLQQRRAEFACAHRGARSARLEDGFWVVEDGSAGSRASQLEPFREMRLPTKLTTDKIEESLASPDTMSFWELPGFITLLEHRAFRRSATGCISTSCWRGPSCFARWCWWRRPSACGCSGAAARR